jgi:hypothetical protein
VHKRNDCEAIRSNSLLFAGLCKVMLGLGPGSTDNVRVRASFRRYLSKFMSVFSADPFFFWRRKSESRQPCRPRSFYIICPRIIYIHTLTVLLMTRLLVTSYCCGVVSYKACHALRLFSNLSYVSIWALIIPDSFTRAVWQIPAQIPSSELGETWRELSVNVADEVSLSYYAGIFNMP